LEDRGSSISMSAALLLFSAAVALAVASWLSSLELAEGVAKILGVAP